MKLIVHNYRRCPFCIRVRIMLHLKGVSYEIVEEPLRVWTDWFVEHIEDKRVPVLRIIEEDGTESIMQHSNDINLWLDRTFGSVEYTPAQGSPAYREMEAWWAWFDGEVKDALDLYKYGKDRVFDAEANVEYMKQLQQLLNKIEVRLADSAYLLGGHMTLADIALIPFMRQIMRTRGGEFDWSELLLTEAWTKQLIETEWFENEVMKKVPVAPPHKGARLARENQ
jgi:glutathione S-transferase